MSDFCEIVQIYANFRSLKNIRHIEHKQVIYISFERMCSGDEEYLIFFSKLSSFAILREFLNFATSIYSDSPDKVLQNDTQHL